MKFQKRRKTFDTFCNQLYLAFQWLYRAFIKKPLYVLNVILKYEKYISKSYYPELKRKSNLRILFEQIICIIKSGMPNKYYYMYGQDVKRGEEYNSYVQYIPFSERRDKLNNSESCCLLRNKFYFSSLCSTLGIKTAENIAICTNNKIFILKDKITIKLDDFIKTNYDLFCKEIDGECGRGVFLLKIENGIIKINDEVSNLQKLEQLLRNSVFLFQKVVVQHSELNRLYSKSINTIRLITVRNLRNNEIDVLPSMLRIGANGINVDNTSQGGIAVGFDIQTGRLHNFGFYKPKFGQKTDRHPNSGVLFKDFVIPYIDKAIEQAKLIHSVLADIHSVGWDIAIGDNGPIFIEGNDNWEINGPQVSNHGMRKEFEYYFFK